MWKRKLTPLNKLTAEERYEERLEQGYFLLVQMDLNQMRTKNTQDVVDRHYAEERRLASCDGG